MTRTELVCIGLLGLGASILPTAVYGLFHTDSWAFHVTRIIFALK